MNTNTEILFPNGHDFRVIQGEENVNITSTLKPNVSTSVNSQNSPIRSNDSLEKAKHGLAGHIVHSFDPFTEADSIAILVQLLTMTANCIGPVPRIRIGNKLQPLRIFTALVGTTSKARKGTSLSIVVELMRRSDPYFVDKCILRGTSTGEGIIQAFSQMKQDKRIQIVEEEFSSILTKKSREGNVITQIIREGFDNDTFQIATRNNPLRVDNGHLSLIGHITLEELSQSLKSVDCPNGFANRLLWILVHRSKELSWGSDIPDDMMDDLAGCLRTAIMFGREQSLLSFSREAQEHWQNIYSELSAERLGIVGAVTSRAEVITVRLASIYALLDCSNVLERCHLEAAHCLWNHSLDCAMQIFDKPKLSGIAQRIFSVIEDKWISRTELSNRVNRHFDREQLNNALDELLSAELIEQMLDKSGERLKKMIRRKPRI